MTWTRPPVRLCRMGPADYPHARAFDEVVESLEYGASRLGYEVEVWTNRVPDAGIAIVIGAHLMPPALAQQLRAPTVVYNFEQIDVSAVRADPSRLLGLHQTIVWDYSPRNLQYIRGLTGNHRLVHVPVGYAPALTRITRRPQDIDVLFYGSLSPRRLHVLDALHARGLRVETAFGVYGEARDTLIARAKVVLNVHYYEARIFEAVRVSFLLANGKAVVAECDARTEMPDEWRSGVCLAEYDQLADACEALVADGARREHLEAAALDTVRRLPVEEVLRGPLAAAASAAAGAA